MINRIWHLVNGIDLWAQFEYLDCWPNFGFLI